MKPLMTEPPLNPPVTEYDRIEARRFELYKKGVKAMDINELEEMVKNELYNALQCLGWEDQDAEDIIDNIEVPEYVLQSYELDNLVAEEAYDSYNDE